jgi:hypothetical protein
LKTKRNETFFVTEGDGLGEGIGERRHGGYGKRITEKWIRRKALDIG